MKGQKAGRATVTADPESRHPPAEENRKNICKLQNHDYSAIVPKKKQPGALARLFPMDLASESPSPGLYLKQNSGIWNRKRWLDKYVRNNITTKTHKQLTLLVEPRSRSKMKTTCARQQPKNKKKIYNQFRKLNNLMSINYATSNVNDARFTGDWHTLLTIDFDVE